MLCESCGESEANVHLTQITDGAVKKLHLCQSCAEESGLTIQSAMSIPEMMFGLGSSSESAPAGEEKACPRCGMRQADFKKTSRLGCPTCYTVFAEELAPLLTAIHKGTQHAGKVPAGVQAAESTPEIDAMQQKLQEAVSAERFEEAAALRDQIRQEKQKTGGGKKPRRKDSRAGS